MPQTYPIEWPVFFTSTIFQSKPVLEKDQYKDIIALSGHPAVGRRPGGGVHKGRLPTAAESSAFDALLLRKVMYR